MNKMSKLQANAKIVLGLVQVLQLCQGTFRIEVPAPFSELSKVFRFVTLDFVSLVNLHCLVSYNWISLFVARCTMPWVRSWLCHCSSQRGVLAHSLMCVRNTGKCTLHTRICLVTTLSSFDDIFTFWKEEEGPRHRV